MTEAEPWIVPQLPDDHDSRILASLEYDRGRVHVVAEVEDGVLSLAVDENGNQSEQQQRLRAAIPGPDSRDAEQIITDVLERRITHDEWPDPGIWAQGIAAALRAAGLLPGPDTITVNREDLHRALKLMHAVATGQPCDVREVAVAYNELVAALSEPPAPKEQQPFDPDLELMANREGNRREVRAYRRDAQPAPSDVQEQQP